MARRFVASGFVNMARPRWRYGIFDYGTTGDVVPSKRLQGPGFEFISLRMASDRADELNADN